MSAYLKSFNAHIDNHALDGKELPKKLKILNWGKNETNDGDVYLTKETMRVFDSYQKRAGRDKAVAIDFDHCTVKNSAEWAQGQPKSIAGYGDPVIIEGDGLYLYNVEWTPLGKKNARNYKDLSPAAILDKQGIVLGLDSVGLTPHGAVAKLNFFSAGGFDNDMIKNMSVGDKGASNAKPTSTGFVVKDAVLPNYNLKGANPAVKLTPSGPALNLNPMVSDMGGSGGGSDMGMLDSEDESALGKINDLKDHEEGEIEDDKEHDPNDPECECASCKSANDLKTYDANDDHFSEYGDVDYADKENHKYPIDTKEHVKAALSYINMPKNSSKYSGNKLSAIKSRIHAAAKKYGIGVADEKTKTMSANSPSFPDAYRAQPLQYMSENNTIIKKMSSEEVIKKMAAEAGVDLPQDGAVSDASLVARVLFAFLAKYEGLKGELAGQITNKANTEEGGLKQFSADMAAMKAEIEALKTQKVEDTTVQDSIEREQLVRQAAREGKLVPLSADQVKAIDIKLLKSIIINQPKNVVPMGSALRVLSVQDDNKPSREKAVAAFEQMIVK